MSPASSIQKLTLTLALIGLTASPLRSADWPQFRGPRHDGTTPSSLPDSWPASGPTVLWRAPVSDGFSSFAVTANRSFTLIRRNFEGVDREACLALDAASGKELWCSPVGIAKYDSGGDRGGPGDGPRSTPAVRGEHVYVFSAQLGLYCLNAATGAPVWSVDLTRDHAGSNIDWQNAASPVIDADKLFVAGGGPGQSLLAFDAQSGRCLWKSQSEKITHSTPVVATLHGVRQVIYFTQAGLVSLNTEDGALLWKHPFDFKVSTAASPVVGNDVVYCSAGYDVGAGAARIVKSASGFQTKELWRIKGNSLANHWSTPVYQNGFLYGLYGFKDYENCPMKCVDILTGKVQWSQPGFGQGNVVLAGGRLLALSATGHLVTLEPAPSAYKELSRVKLLEGKCWSTPVVSDSRIYARSVKEAVCIDASTQHSAAR